MRSVLGGVHPEGLQASFLLVPSLPLSSTIREAGRAQCGPLYLWGERKAEHGGPCICRGEGRAEYEGPLCLRDEGRAEHGAFCFNFVMDEN